MAYFSIIRARFGHYCHYLGVICVVTPFGPLPAAGDGGRRQTIRGDTSHYMKNCSDTILPSLTS